VNFSTINYAPLMFQKPAEVTAYGELALAEKMLCLPTFRFRPWANSKSLDAALSKLIEISADAPMACMLDASWERGRGERVAFEEFETIRNDETGELFFEYIRRADNLFPIVPLTDAALRNVVFDPNHRLNDHGFGFVVDIADLGKQNLLRSAMSAINHNNYFCIIDCNWSADPTLQAIAAANLANSLFAINERCTLFVSGSSFPDSFSKLGASASLAVREIELFDIVVRTVAQRFNDSTVRYSDWATTRRPSNERSGRGAPRIDLPNGRLVEVFRDTDSEENVDCYANLANTAWGNFPWVSPPQCWGHYCLDLTRLAVTGGIYNARKNTAARVNIHLHKMIAQSATGFVTSDEPFTL
jgi:hypothetical protein